MSVRNTLTYQPVLQDLVASYNATRHSAHGLRPADVTPADGETIWERTLLPHMLDHGVEKPRFAVGDHVFLVRERQVFRKGYREKFTGEIFVVSAVQRTSPPTYRVRDMSDEPVAGTFYAQEMHKVDPPDEYEVERVLRTVRTKRGGVKHLVRWRHYGPQFDSWVDDKDLRGI